MSDYGPSTSNWLAGDYIAYEQFKRQQIVDAQYAVWLAEVKADAWDEGHATALRYAAYFGEHVPNPYRQGEEQ